jgi:hypothetical protein
MHRLFALFFLVALAGCGSEANRLYGSMSQVWGNLDFNRVQIIRSAGSSADDVSVSIEYQRLSGQNVSAKVAKLTVQVGDLAQMAGNPVDLTEVVHGLPRGTLQRVESTTTDYLLQVGNIQFDQEPVAGANLSGKFHTTLDDPAAGRTLNGDFQAKVEAL